MTSGESSSIAEASTDNTQASTGVRQSATGANIVSVKPELAKSNQSGISRKEILFAIASIVPLTALVFIVFHRCLGINFLLDDYLHLGCAYKAFHCSSPLEALLAINDAWTGSKAGYADGLTSFRPGITLSFWADYLLWGLNASGYHASNLLAFALCAWLVGIFSYQLTADCTKTTRWLTSASAATLFAVYPIHAESVAWIIGRVDVNCMLFYIASLCLYFQYRKNGKTTFLVLSLISGLLSLCNKEMAVTLPVAVIAAEALLPGPLVWQAIPLRKRIISAGLYVALLLGFMVVRTLIIGTVVGGYGATNLRVLLRALRNFLDVATLSKLMFGLNEEQSFSQSIATTANICWSIVGAGILLRLAQTSSRLKVLAFLVIFLVLLELPTFQLWHIYPNLVGSRLFFLGSSVLCALLAVALVPPLRFAKSDTSPQAGNPNLAAEPQSRSKMLNGFNPSGGSLSGRSLTFFLHTAPLVALSVLGWTWYEALQHNLFAWVEAGNQITRMREQLSRAARNTAEGKAIVLIDLPQDYSGAGLVGRPQLLDLMMNRPIANGDFSKKIVTIERTIPGSRDYMAANLLSSIYADSRVSGIFHWSMKENSYVPWTKPVENASDRSLQGHLIDGQLVADKQKCTVENPSAPKIMWFSTAMKTDPFSTAWIEASIQSSVPPRELARNVRLVWRSQDQPASWIDYSEGPWAELKIPGSGSGEPKGDSKFIFIPASYRSWLLNGSIVDLGLEFYPGTYRAQLTNIEAGTSSRIAPLISLSSASDRSLCDKITPTAKTGDRLTVKFDAENIQNARAVKIFISRPNEAFADSPEKQPNKKNVAFECTVNALKGSYDLPLQDIKQHGRQQVAVLALDAKGDPIGYLSEPRTFMHVE